MSPTYNASMVEINGEENVSREKKINAHMVFSGHLKWQLLVTELRGSSMASFMGFPVSPIYDATEKNAI